LPLSQKHREIFNETAAIEQFSEWQGLPYGFHTFLLSAIDTPNDNFPGTFPKEFWPIAFALMEKVSP
jgi:hypothetical protein